MLILGTHLLVPCFLHKGNVELVVQFFNQYDCGDWGVDVEPNIWQSDYVSC